ncbi:MAG: hypothetical protein N2115_02495 [bacterium]|nr:hypothetical protein [bacterium]
MNRLLFLFIFLGSLLVYCQTEWIQLQPVYIADVGMFVVDSGNQPLKIEKETQKFIRFEYPFATIKEIFIELRGEMEVYVLEEDEKWKGPFLVTDRGFIPETKGRKTLCLKVFSKKGAQVQRITADCGRSKKVLEQMSLPQTIETIKTTGDLEIVSGQESLILHPTKYYYAISETKLTPSQMRTYSETIETENSFSVGFLVENRAFQDIEGLLSVVLPGYARKENTKVYFQYAGDSFGISQPPDTIQFNDEKPYIPGETGWAGPAYRQVKKGDVMTITWNKLRSHRQPTTHFSSHLPVSFKGDVLWEYRKKDGTWEVLQQKPWVSAKIPEDASRNPFQIRATCTGNEDKGKFSVQALAIIPQNILSEEDYFLPIDDSDGRNNPLSGWSIKEMRKQGENTVLILNLQLKANPNPLLTENRSYSSLLNPGHQARIKIEVKK